MPIHSFNLQPALQPMKQCASLCETNISLQGQLWKGNEKKMSNIRLFNAQPLCSVQNTFIVRGHQVFCCKLTQVKI
jgi:hypothetical protein